MRHRPSEVLAAGAVSGVGCVAVCTGGISSAKCLFGEAEFG